MEFTGSDVIFFALVEEPSRTFTTEPETYKVVNFVKSMGPIVAVGTGVCVGTTVGAGVISSVGIIVGVGVTLSVGAKVVDSGVKTGSTLSPEHATKVKSVRIIKNILSILFIFFSCDFLIGKKYNK